MIIIKAWCSYCGKFKRADIGRDPKVSGRITEILRKHRKGFRTCPGSHTDADPVA